MEFKRIQFTPDLLPGDITGGYVFEIEKNRFTLRKGPIFTNILLADEINRASPKTQSALLEAMQEYQVTMEGETLALVQPFIVIATQNPIEYEGTFPLPEAQLDRFMIKLAIGYPTPEEKDEILLRRSERKQDLVDLKAIISPGSLLEMCAAVEDVYIDPDVRRYMVELAAKSRRHQQVAVGVSPRGSLALLKLTRAWAAIQSRDYVVPDDVKMFIQPALSHRIILDSSLWDTKKSENAIISQIADSVAVPVLTPKMNNKTLTIGLIIMLLLAAGLASRSGDIVWLIILFLAYLGSGFLQAPEREKLSFTANRSLDQTRADGIWSFAVNLNIRNESPKSANFFFREPIQPDIKITDGKLEKWAALSPGESTDLKYSFSALRGNFT
ncbi:MAG: MoxR family ATPase [Anaerolineales bacterium]|nr:MoxR family ATPase [Anaerolineales bacterium]